MPNVKHIVGADEFGCHFFSHDRWKREKIGARHVTTSVKEDKRQHTGDIPHNAAGGIIWCPPNLCRKDRQDGIITCLCACNA